MSHLVYISVTQAVTYVSYLCFIEWQKIWELASLEGFERCYFNVWQRPLAGQKRKKMLSLPFASPSSWLILMFLCGADRLLVALLMSFLAVLMLLLLPLSAVASVATPSSSSSSSTISLALEELLELLLAMERTSEEVFFMPCLLLLTELFCIMSRFIERDCTRLRAELERARLRLSVEWQWRDCKHPEDRWRLNAMEDCLSSLFCDDTAMLTGTLLDCFCLSDCFCCFWFWCCEVVEESEWDETTADFLTIFVELRRSRIRFLPPLSVPVEIDIDLSPFFTFMWSGEELFFWEDFLLLADDAETIACLSAWLTWLLIALLRLLDGELLISELPPEVVPV